MLIPNLTDKLISISVGLLVIFFILKGIAWAVKSEKLSAWVTPKRFFLFGLFYITAYGIGQFAPYIFKANAQTGWTSAQETELRNGIKQICVSKNMSESDTKKLVSCMMSKYKKSQPNGLKGLTQPQMAKLSETFLLACVEDHEITSIHATWNAANELKLKNSIINIPEFEPLAIDIRRKIAECIVSRFKASHPEGMAQSYIEKEMETVLVDCVEAIKANR